MKTRPNSDKRVNIITLGCSKNTVDSEVILTQLRGNGIEAMHESGKGAEVVIINTCGFIDNAKEESINTILGYSEEKSAGRIEKLFVTGCLSERYRQELQSEIPGIDGWFGTTDLPALLKKFNADYKKELLGERMTSTAPHFAYLKISEGCDRPCSFCAIPLMRGKHKSRSLESLVEESQWLVRRGVKEIILIAQDLTYYGLDIYGKRELNELLKRLSDVDGLKWLRLHYAFPSGFPVEILQTIRERENICNYIDIPLQHISDRMLKSMRRGINKEKSLELVRRIREDVPGIAIRTTMIAGYPGETQADHEEQLQFIRDMRFERLGVFTYSHEEDTHAFTLDDDVPAEKKTERLNRIMETQQEISLENNRNLLGRTMKVLLDRKEGEFFFGRTEMDSPEVDNEVMLTGNGMEVGEFYDVRITDATEYDLQGELNSEVQIS